MAGTITQKLVGVNERLRLVIFTCVADSSDGSFPATDMDGYIASELQGWRLIDVLAFPTPSGTAPTADSDVTVKTKSYPTGTSTISPGTPRDVLGGNGADIISATAEIAVGPSNIVEEILAGNFTLGITNNAVHSATVTIIYKFVWPW